MEYKEYKLEELLNNIIDNRGKNPKKYYENEKYPVVDNFLIKNEYYPNLKNVNRYIDEETFNTFLRGYVHKNMPIMTLVGNGIGNVTLCPTDEMAIIQNTIGFNVNENLNEIYLYYAFKFKNLEIKSLNRGTSQPSIKQTELKKLVFKIPLILNQNKTVEILSSLDKKIELNNQINDNLRNYAQNLFKDWFVDFNYPNSDGERKETDLGLIPIDWSIGHFDDNKLSKIIKSGVDKFDGEKKYLATADVSDTSITNFTMIDYNSKPSRANMTPIANSVWFAKMQGSKKNILVTNYTNEMLNEYIFSTGFMGIECLNNSINYLWEVINSEDFQSQKDALSTGTLMAGISNSTITNYKYLIPTEKVLNDFNDIMSQINNKIYNNQNQNETLTQLCDTLLPKLMNGEIDLENIEI